jgi:hypothetical protein
MIKPNNIEAYSFQRSNKIDVDEFLSYKSVFEYNISVFTFSNHARVILQLTQPSVCKGPSVRMCSLLNIRIVQKYANNFENRYNLLE